VAVRSRKCGGNGKKEARVLDKKNSFVFTIHDE